MKQSVNSTPGTETKHTNRGQMQIGTVQTEKGEPMAEYIDKQKVLKLMRYAWDENGWDTEYGWLRQHIADEPAADVRENVRGFWYALEKGDRGYSAGDFKCSICGESNHTWLPKPNFCPNCGADLRGGKDGK